MKIIKYIGISLVVIVVCFYGYNRFELIDIQEKRLNFSTNISKLTRNVSINTCSKNILSQERQFLSSINDIIDKLSDSDEKIKLMKLLRDKMEGSNKNQKKLLSHLKTITGQYTELMEDVPTKYSAGIFSGTRKTISLGTQNFNDALDSKLCVLDF